MRTLAETARGIWWAFAAAGGGACLAALVAATLQSSPTPVIGVWALAAGAVILAGVYRARGAFEHALPFVGAAMAGVVLGAALVILPSRETRTGVIAIGVWGIVAAAGYLAVSRVARANAVDDGGLYATSWLGLAAGMAIVVLPVFGFSATGFTAAASLAVTGVITVVASARLRVLPFEAPTETSRRELRRRERAGRRR